MVKVEYTSQKVPLRILDYAACDHGPPEVLIS